MDDWKIKMGSRDCPFKVYPNWASDNPRWQKGYCKISNTVAGIDTQCNYENCPLKVVKE